MRNNQGVSGIIAAILLVGLVVVAIGIVGLVIRNTISEQIERTESCFGNFNKVTINNLYTCHNTSSGNLLISLSIGDITVEKVLIAISGTGTTKSFEIHNSSSTITGFTNYPSGLDSVKLPSKNGGLTYIYDLTTGGFSGKPDKIEIAPTISGTQCEISDSLLSIDDC
tara:strand:- start:34 stop:537 length:504 start_codon:yes stop_codon:yes gene_type:complete